MQGLVAFGRGSDYTEDRVGFLGVDPVLQRRRLRPGLRPHGESTAELRTFQSRGHTP